MFEILPEELERQNIAYINRMRTYRWKEYNTVLKRILRHLKSFGRWITRDKYHSPYSFKKAWKQGLFKPKDKKLGPGWHLTWVYNFYVIEVSPKVRKIKRCLKY